MLLNVTNTPFFTSVKVVLKFVKQRLYCGTVRCLTSWIRPHLPMASRSDASQNLPISPFCYLEIIFCDINFLI